MFIRTRSLSAIALAALIAFPSLASIAAPAPGTLAQLCWRELGYPAEWANADAVFRLG